jgi:hypothetical protein
MSKSMRGSAMTVTSISTQAYSASAGGLHLPKRLAASGEQVDL